MKSEADNEEFRAHMRSRMDDKLFKSLLSPKLKGEPVISRWVSDGHEDTCCRHSKIGYKDVLAEYSIVRRTAHWLHRWFVCEECLADYRQFMGSKA